MEDKFNKIFNLYNQDIYRLIYSYTLNETEAKDILQETFLKLYKNIKNISDNEKEIKSWLIKVASNNCKDYFRTIWKKKVILKEDCSNDITFEQLHKIESIEILKQLDKKIRIPLYLYYFEGYKIKEISNILKIKESTIKMRLAKAKKIIKEEIK